MSTVLEESLPLCTGGSLLHEFCDLEHIDEALHQVNSLFERSNIKCAAFCFICNYLQKQIVLFEFAAKRILYAL